MAAAFNPPVRPTKVTNKPEVKLLEADFGDGYTQSVGDGMNHIRQVLSLSWELLTSEQADAIEDFFVSMKGSTPFNWTRANGRTLLFTCKEWSRSDETPNSFEATLRQSFILGA